MKMDSWEVNSSLDCGHIVSDWREAWIVPVFKKGDKHKVANYPQVSLTSISNKLLVYTIHNNIVANFDKHNIPKDSQHGFQKQHYREMHPQSHQLKVTMTIKCHNRTLQTNPWYSRKRHRSRTATWLHEDRVKQTAVSSSARGLQN